MKKIVFLGPQGSGKGTIADILKEKYGFAHISSGEMFRDHMKRKTEIGKRIDDVMKKGGLVSDDIVIDMIKERIKRPDCEKGFILDGTPRTVYQAEILDKEIGFDYVIVIDVPKDISLRRLSGRRQCRKCSAIYNIYPECQPHPKKKGVCDKDGGELYQRDDDKEGPIKERLRQYDEKTKPIIKYYGDKAKIVDGTGRLEDITKRVEDAIDL